MHDLLHYFCVVLVDKPDIAPTGLLKFDSKVVTVELVRHLDVACSCIFVKSALNQVEYQYQDVGVKPNDLKPEPVNGVSVELGLHAEG